MFTRGLWKRRVVDSFCVWHKRLSAETKDGEGDERTGGLVMTKTGEHVTVWVNITKSTRTLFIHTQRYLYLHTISATLEDLC